MSELNDKGIAEDTEELESEINLNQERSQDAQGSNGYERLILFIIAGFVVLLDQLTKYIISISIPTYSYWAPFPAIENFFRIAHTTNTGVAFGLFPNGNTIFAIFAVIVSIAIIYYNHTLSPGHRGLRLALGLQLGGAIGNLISRISPGYVVDFLDFGPWPIFNVADIAIVSGTMLLAWIMLQEERAQKAAQDDLSKSENHEEDGSNLVAEPATDQANEAQTN